MTLEEKLSTEIGKLVIAVHQRDTQIEMLQEQIKKMAEDKPKEAPADGS